MQIGKMVVLAACLTGAWRAPVHAAGKERDVAVKGSASEWISSDDYPAPALRFELEGAITALLTIGIDGNVTKCAVIESSKHDVLDLATCDLLKERAKFEPALDRRGRAIESTFRQRFRWTFPEDVIETEADAEGVAQWDLVVGADDSVESCTMTNSIGTVDSSTSECDNLEPGERGFLPAVRETGYKGRVALRYMLETTLDRGDVARRLNEPGWQRLSFMHASSIVGVEGGKAGSCVIEETHGAEALMIPLCAFLAERQYSPFKDDQGKSVERKIETISVAYFKPLAN